MGGFTVAYDKGLPAAWGLAIDIGANMGYDTLLMSTAVGENGLVYTFEPDLESLKQLITNIQSLDHGNVTVESLALSDRPGFARIFPSGDANRGMSNLRNNNETLDSQPILTARLDSLLNPADFSRINFVKIDIEGYEYKAIQGLGELIEKVDVLASEITPQFLQQCEGSTEQLFDYMRNHGFVSFCAEPCSDGQWVKADHNYATTASHFDALFCRNVPESLRPLIIGS